MPKAALFLAAPLFLLACNIPSDGDNPGGINVASADAVGSCTPVTRLTSTTGLSGPALREERFRATRNKMAQDALGAGADTIVFEIGGPDDPDALFIEAAAYRCLS